MWRTLGLVMNEYKTIHVRIVIWRKISFIWVTAIIISLSLDFVTGGSYQQRVLATTRKVHYSESHPLARASYIDSVSTNRKTLDSAIKNDESGKQYESSQDENPTSVMLAVYSTNATSESISYASSTFQIDESNTSSSNSSYDTLNDSEIVLSSTLDITENENSEDITSSTQILSQNDVTTIVDNDEVDKLLVHNQTDIDTVLTPPNNEEDAVLTPTNNVSGGEIKEFDQNLKNNSSVDLNDTRIDQNSNNSQLNDGHYTLSASEDPPEEEEINNLYQPIRISAVLTKETRQFLTEKQQKYLLDDVLSPALTAWSSALSVVPVIGNLIIDRAQLFDGKSCGPGVDSGLPSPLVPEDHMENGIPNTDLVVYISISQFEKNAMEVIATAGVGSFKEDVFEEVEEIDDMFEDDYTFYHADDSHSVDLYEGDDSDFDVDNNYTVFNNTNASNEKNATLADNINVTKDELGTNKSNLSNGTLEGHSYLVHQRQNNSGKINDVLGQIVTCNPNSTTILLDDVIYMYDNDTYVMCHIHDDEFYDHNEVIECALSRNFLNEIIHPNATALLPCDMDPNITLIDSMSEKNSTFNLSLCYQVVSITNSTDLKYDLTPYSYLSCSQHSFNSNLTDMSTYISMNNDTSLYLSNSSAKNDSLYITENEPVNAISNETENDNGKENNQLNFVDETLPICPNSALASASYCSTDQFDRPIAGTLNYCINEFFFSEENLQQNILASIHELAHVLGLNSQSLAYFRDEFGTPLTPRDESGNVVEKKTMCTGVNNKEMSIPLPSEKILQFRQVRDILVADVVTPNVRQIARNQFDCQSLPGAELENGDVNADVCIGNHWGRRVFRTDVLSPALDDVPFSMRITPLTLAYFKDSGWYNIDVSRSSFGSSWGRGAGCSFVDEKCVEESGIINGTNEQFFCDQRRGLGNLLNEIHGCSSDYSKKAVCSLMDYEGTDEIIPEPYQYFGNNYGSQWGGIDPDLEYCPAFVGFSNGQCNDEDNIALKIHSSESFGLQNSRCVYSEIGSRRTSLCLPLACVISDQTLRLKVDKKWRICEYEGQKIELKGRNSDHVICPNPSRLCPSFYCPRNCLEFEGAVCNYTSGKCECPHGSEHCHKSNATTNLTAISNDVKESAIYFANITALQKDPINIFEETVSAFEKMSIREILYMLASIVAGLLTTVGVVYLILRHIDKKNRFRREANKEKMLATVIVDLRIRENDRRRKKERRKKRNYVTQQKNKKRKRRLRRHPYQTENDQIILSIDSFSTESTAPAESTEGERTVCAVDDSTFDNCFVGDKMNEFDSEITVDIDHIDLAVTEGLDGNIYSDDFINEGSIDSNLTLKKNDLRHRNRINVFRQDL